MSIQIVRFGTPRLPNEGLRIGTVRRPPRGVPKSQYASGNWYDIWFPTLAPSLPTMKIALGATTDAGWNTFTRKYKAEMRSPDARHALELLAALSQKSNFAVGCYCEDETRCHRSILRQLLRECGAKLA